MTPATASLAALKRELSQAADPRRARNLAWFFKTGKGEYGFGDKFIGITVPEQRKIARSYRDLQLADIAKLLRSRIHEHRFTALEILVMEYEAGDTAAKQRIFDFYLKHTRRINNWDLVDASAAYIVGQHLANRSRRVLYRLARSANLWERRIAMVATIAFIKGVSSTRPSQSRKCCSRTGTTSSTRPSAGCCARPARLPRLL